MTNYTDFPTLAHVYLEDSYVRDITETQDTLTFSLDAVTTAGHPRYHTPEPGEQYCYLNAILILSGATKIYWLERFSQISTDADSETDMGNIDSFQLDGDHYDIAGDWGRVWIYTLAKPQLAIV